MKNQIKQSTSTNSELRFAAMPRVSTEKQAAQGESLRTQTTDLKEAAKQLGGKVVSWFGGQEHAVAGYERKEINKLLNDAQKKSCPGNWNAVMYTNIDRWSRDNEQSKKGLRILRDAGKRFFIRTMEIDLFDPKQLLFLGMSVEFAEFRALDTNFNSVTNKIQRAKRGRPACGTLPHARTFDKKTETWGTDPKKKTVIEDIAERYLKGDRLLDLAIKYGFDKSGLHKILTKRCGDVWMQKYRRNGEIVEVKTKVPPLLEEETIQAIKERLQANRTYAHGSITNLYLLSRMIFCEHCGYSMFGQTALDKYKYYRHPSTKHVKKCNRPGCSKNIKADDIEDIVMRHLFEMFGNPAKVQKAIEAAIPNRQKLEQDKKRSADIAIELNQIVQGRNKALRLILKGKLTEAQAEKELDKLNDREKRLTDEQNRLSENRQNVPDVHQIKAMSQKVVKRFKWHNIRLMLEKKYANREYELMTYIEKKKLLELVFSGLTINGHRMGVFIEWAENKGWKFNIRGHLINETGLLPMSDSRKDACFGDFGGAFQAHQQQKLLSKSAAC